MARESWWTTPALAAPDVLASAITRAFDGMHAQFAFVVAAQIGAYAFAAYAALLPAMFGGLIALIGLWILLWSLGPSVNDLAWMAVIVAVPWISGRVVRDQRKQRQQLETIAARLEREREASAHLAVAEERARIAQELHHEIADAIELMIAQAVIAEEALPVSPADACTALSAVQEKGRVEITKMRRMLQLLRTDRRPGYPLQAPRSPPSPRRLDVPRCPSPRLDLFVALICFVSVETWVIADSDFSGPERLASALLAVPATVPLLWRKRMPVTVLCTTSGAVGVQQTLVDFTELTPVVLLIAPLVAVYTLAAETPVRRALCGIAPSLVFAAAATAITEGTASKFFDGIVLYSVYATGPVLCGYAVRLHRRQAEQLRILTGRRERERDARARLAVLDERTRMAREFHDLIAHGVSVMVLQAGAAERVLSSKPEQARQATRAAQEAGRAALKELDPLLGVLTTDDQQHQHGAPPSLNELDALIEKMRRAGLPVDLHVHGSPATLPASVDACAYRVIQEGLTNAVKHGAPLPVTVTVSIDHSTVTLEIVNVIGATVTAGERGHGLIGMRERIELYGGELRAEARLDGHYVLRARLPWNGDRP